jgi:hypothetical protein
MWYTCAEPRGGRGYSRSHRSAVAFACGSLLADTIFVANATTGTIGEYTTSGATVNASLVTGLNGPAGLAIAAPVASVPEPSTFLLRKRPSRKGPSVQQADMSLHQQVYSARLLIRSDRIWLDRTCSQYFCRSALLSSL